MKAINETYEAMFNGLPINTNPINGLGCHAEILVALQSIMESMRARHSRIFVTMLTIRLPDLYNGQVDFPAFLESFIRYERRHYGDVQYVWRVECNAGTVHPHWHVILVYDGNKTQSAWNHQLKAAEYWSNALKADATGLVHVTQTQSQLSAGDGFMIRRGDMVTFQDCFQFCSYIAKVGINMLPENTRAFGSSMRL